MNLNRPNVKASGRPAAISVGREDCFVVEQGGQAKKLSQSSLRAALDTALHFPLAHRIESVVGSSGCAVSTVVRDGLTGQRFYANAAVSSMSADLTLPSRTLASGSVGFLIYVENCDGETLNTILFLSDGAGFTNYYNVTFSLYQPGWYWLPVHPPASQAGSKWAVGGGAPAFGTTNFTRARVRVDFTNGKRPAVGIYGIYENPRSTKGQVVICFDDCSASGYTLGLPIVERYMLKATYPVISDLIDTGSSMTLAQLKSAVTRGHEAVVHGPIAGTGSLQNYEGAGDRYNQVVNDVRTHQDYIINNGLSTNGSHNIYVYPQGYMAFGGNGSGNTEIRDALKSLGIVAARGVSRTRFDMASHPIASALDLFDLKIAGHQYAAGGEAANIAAIIQRIRDAGQQGRHIILMFHNVVAGTPAADGEIQTTSLTSICEAVADEIAAGRLQTGTLTSLYGSLAANNL